MNGHPAGSGARRRAANYALALNHSDWESEFFQSFAAQFQQRGELKRCVDSVDLLADVLTGLVEIVVLDADFAGLDATTVARIASGTRVVGLCSDLAGEARLRQWGIENVVLLEPSELPNAVRSVVEIVLALEAELRHSESASGVPDDLGALVAADEAGQVAAGTGRAQRIVVWSPVAGAGVSTIATGIAEAIAATGTSTMLIDADLNAPGLAEALALTDEAGGLLRACRQAERGMFAAGDLISASRSLGRSLRFLTGLPAAHRRAEIKPVALARVLEVAGQIDQAVVVDLGAPWLSVSPLLDGSELNYALAAHDEVRTSLVAELKPGDVLVAVVDCSPIAIAKAAGLIAQVQIMSPEATMRVVVNRARKSVLGASGLAEFGQLLAQVGHAGPVSQIALDLGTADKALLGGQTLTEANSRSAAVADLRSLALEALALQLQPELVSA